MVRHAELAVRCLGLREELLRFLAVVGVIAGEEHSGVVMLRVGYPRASTHAGVHVECALEMVLGGAPGGARRREDAKVPRYGADGDFSGEQGVMPA
jgi:hypothetical protein